MVSNSQLCRTVAEKCGFTISDVRQVIDEYLKTITNTLIDGEDIRITNFIKLKVVVIPECERVSPISKDGTMYIDEHRSVRAKLSTNLKKKVRERIYYD